MKLDDVMKLQHFVGILTAIHMYKILYCPLSIWAKESPSQIPSLRLPGQREVPQCPEEQLGTRHFRTCNVTEFSYRTAESRLYWSWFMFSIILLSAAASLRGPDWSESAFVFGGWVLSSCWTALHWNTMGLHGFRLGCTGLPSCSEDLTIPAQIQKAD